jgi:hypothetical protein
VIPSGDKKDQENSMSVEQELSIVRWSPVGIRKTEEDLLKALLAYASTISSVIPSGDKKAQNR